MCEPVTYGFTLVAVHMHLTRAVSHEDLTTVCHQIFVKIQELVSNFLWTRTLAFVILKIEKHIDLKVWNKRKRKNETERKWIQEQQAVILKTKLIKTHFGVFVNWCPTCEKSLSIKNTTK